MKKFILFLAGFLCLALFLSRCVLLKMRWTDKKSGKIFAAKNVPLELHDTLIGKTHIHYAVTGSSTLPTLVFIHGSPGSWFHYHKYMLDPDLRKKYRIISFDRPGYGHSNYGEALHLQDQCRLMMTVLKGLKNDQPMILFGHSYGGAVVAKLAADAPGMFKKILIAAGSLDPALEKKETWRHLMENKPLSWFLPGAFRQSNTELLYLKKDLVLLAANLHKITDHVQFVHGDKDTWVPIENVAYCLKMMVNAASTHSDTIRGVRHQIPWQRRKELKKILLELE